MNPIGKRLVRGKTDFLTVVGVVEDTHYRDLRNPRPSIYIPLRQSIFPSGAPTTLVIATDARAASFATELRRVVTEAAPGVAVAAVVPFESFCCGLARTASAECVVAHVVRRRVPGACRGSDSSVSWRPPYGSERAS